MEALRKMLAGKKTYLVCVAAILGVVIAWSSGSMGLGAAVKAIVEALVAMTIRAGIAK